MYTERISLLPTPDTSGHVIEGAIMLGFIKLFDTGCDYNLQITVTHTYTHTSVDSHVFTSRCLPMKSEIKMTSTYFSELDSSLRFEIITAVSVKVTVFFDVTKCSLVGE